MVGRRHFLGAALGWAAGSGAASAQTPGGRPGNPPPATGKRSAAKPTYGTSTGRVPPVPKDVVTDEDSEAAARVKRLLGPIRDRHHLPALWGGLVLGDKLAMAAAVGVRKIGAVQPAKVTDRVHLGSCTKALTATMIATLVEDGRLDWGSTLEKVFPNNADAMHPDFRKVTLSHLLTHRAGLPHDVPWWDFSNARPNDATAQRLAVLRQALAEPPRSKPGSTYAYSNVGYALAGLMAEQVSGRSWEALMYERLFKPLGITSAGTGPPGRPRGVTDAWGHRERDGHFTAVWEDNAPSMGPAGTVHIGFPDWAKFAALHMKAGRGTPALLKPAMFRTLHTPPPGFEYAGGWFAVDRSWANGKALMHKGSNLTWYATVWLAPARDLGVLVATNQGGDAADAASDEATQALLSLAPYARNPGRRAMR